jgi:hypothetical protein
MIFGATYFKETFISDIVDSVNSVNDEYDGFLPFVMAEHDPSAAETEINTWKDKTYNKHNFIKSQNGFVEEYYDNLLCHR